MKNLSKLFSRENQLSDLVTKSVALTVAEDRTLTLTLPEHLRSQSHSATFPDKSAVDLATSTEFSKEIAACHPFPRLTLLNNSIQPLPIPKELRTESNEKNMRLKLEASILDCTGFESLFDAHRFECAIDRDIYTRWGPGAFTKSYYTGLNRSRHIINDRDWIGYTTTQRGDEAYPLGFISQTMGLIARSYYTVLYDKYLLEYTYTLHYSLDDTPPAILNEYFDTLHQKLMARIKINPDHQLKEDILQKISTHHRHYRDDQAGPIQWTEKTVDEIDSDPGVVEEISETAEETDDSIATAEPGADSTTGIFTDDKPLSKDCILSPFRADDRDKKLSPPIFHLQEEFMVRGLLPHYKELIAQIKTALDSHQNCDRHPNTP